MREIVDKHFPDNWILPVYQGYLVDITEYWSKFPAAQKALENNMYMENVQEIAEKYQKKIPDLKVKLKAYLKAGKLDEEMVLQNINALLHTLRECNVTIRWLMLH